MSHDISPGENVIAVSFTQDSNAYEALTLLKELDVQGQLELQGAAVVARDADGQVTVKDEITDGQIAGTATGGVIGLLVGILGGPLGILIGGATGVLFGSLFDVHDAETSDSVLSDISQSLRPRRTALLADVTEQSPEVVDTAMIRLGGSVLRRSVADVEAEIAAADHAQKEAKKEARKELRKANHDKQREEIHAKVEAMKARLHHTKETTPAHS
jgi:uncharacterized membrane protein